MITENLSTLKIHKLTQAQYDREFEAGNIDPSALYLTPDENNRIFVQNEEPIDAEDGALWVDMDVEGTISGGNSSNDGYTPVKGIDYWTEEDKAEIKSYVDDAILGGTW